MTKLKIVTVTYKLPVNTTADNYKKIKMFAPVASKLYAFDRSPSRKIRELREILRSSVVTTERILKHERYGLEITINENMPLKDALLAIRECIRSKRKELKEPLEVNRFGYSREAHCHLQPMCIYREYTRKQLGKEKLPTTPSEHIGIELELTLPKGVSFDALLPLKDFVNVTSDASIRPDEHYYGAEIRMIATRSTYEDRVNQVCTALQGMGAKVNTSCGLHVHLDQRNATREEIETRFSNLVKYQKWLFAIVPPSRRDNTYCRMNRSPRPDAQSGRYYAINGDSLRRHRSIEVRLHSGTVNPDKINKWVTLLLAIEHAKPVLRVARTIDGIGKQITVKKDVLEYVKARQSQFAVSTSNINPTEEN